MDVDRYHRQKLLPFIGAGGQAALGASHALLVGCGALGTVIADALVRAGIGRLTIVDRDIVEATNLQRQVLFDERDAREGMPKAEAARRRLASINSGVAVEAFVDDFNHRTAGRFIGDIDLVIDGLDNFETRYLLNDLAVLHHLPYVYGGAVGTTGMAMTILPHGRHATGSGRRIEWSDDEATPCLRCVFPAAPPPGSTPTCDTAGVLGPVVWSVAAHQATEALKLLTNNVAAIDRSLWSLDAWGNRTSAFGVSDGRREDCPCCGLGDFEHAAGTEARAATSLCGRDAVQIGADGSRGPVDLAALADRLATHGTFQHTAHLLRGEFGRERSSNGEPIRLMLFPDGRAIIGGTTEPEAARSIYARYVGT